ncbi:Nuc-1 negative regulatory protein preg [Penicillium diatomitis]|uniref:Nuc-1 negative regulatory protein preg n=1 Tax=Penicillium diatomitis TaxID=2819901 RepID=A0A9W9WV68_9EURO|nr:Nuc-1 negative regulatory protein preg [Penicillium diatomitis]KAJ5477330.1 Nuc-1 negative regulatory protein preg [Penicillium diatomitis]
MLASSPSPSSAALRSPLPNPRPHQLPHPTGAAQYEPSSASQFSSPRSSRLAIEELRSALNRHSVDSTSPESPASLKRRALAASTASPSSSSSSASAAVETTAPNPALALDSDSATATAASLSSDSSATFASVNPPLPPDAAQFSTAETAAAPSMPAPENSGSNKRNSQCDHHSPNVAAPTDSSQDAEVSQPKRRRSSRVDVKILPARYEEVEPRDLVVLISSMLMELIRFNDKIPLHQGRLTRFHSRSPPRISVQDYLQRLTTHATLSPPILLSMVYYIDRLCALYPAFTVSSLTIHRFLIVSATVASKGLSDSFWTNKTYARVGGITMTELAMLELEFLFKVQWRIVPQPEILEDYYQSLIERCEGFEIERISADHNTAPTAPSPAANTPSA